jgi:hypothetical protein
MRSSRRGDSLSPSSERARARFEELAWYLFVKYHTKEITDAFGVDASCTPDPEPMILLPLSDRKGGRTS